MLIFINCSENVRKVSSCNSLIVTKKIAQHFKNKSPLVPCFPCCLGFVILISAFG